MGLIWGNTVARRPPGVLQPELHRRRPVPAQGAGLRLPRGDRRADRAVDCSSTRTWTGRAIRASAVNPQGARLVGVNVAAVATMTFAIGVATTGAGGSIVGVLYPFLPGSHYLWISRLLGIIVLGGMGSLPGAVVGAAADRDRRVADEHLHLAAVDDRGALRRDLPRAARAAAGAARRAAAGGRGGGMSRVVPRSPWTWLVVAGWAFVLLFPVASSDLFFQNMIILSLIVRDRRGGAEHHLRLRRLRLARPERVPGHRRLHGRAAVDPRSTSRRSCSCRSPGSSGRRSRRCSA